MPKKKLLVFLSHANEDKPTIRELSQRLKDEGFDPWLDQERILPGQDWQLEIEQALRKSDAILVSFSKKSLAKEGYVQREYKKALDYQKEKPEGTIFVIPVRLGNCEIPFFLRDLQCVDYPSGYERLVMALNVRAGKSASARKSPVNKDKEHAKQDAKQVQIVLEGTFDEFNETRQEDLVSVLASMLRVDSENIRILQVTSGSIVVLLEMPTAAAIRLIYFALRKDERLRSKGILTIQVENEFPILLSHIKKVARKHDIDENFHPVPPLVERALTLARGIDDKELEEEILNYLGDTYTDEGNSSEALRYYEQSLLIAREIGDKKMEETSLESLGKGYFVMSDASNAIKYYELAIAIANDIGDEETIGRLLNSVGVAYIRLGEVNRAIGYYEQALALFNKSNNVLASRIPLTNLGNAYSKLGEAHKALQYYEQALSIFNNSDMEFASAVLLSSMGKAYMEAGDLHKAREFLEKAFVILKKFSEQTKESYAELSSFNDTVSNSEVPNHLRKNRKNQI